MFLETVTFLMLALVLALKYGTVTRIVQLNQRLRDAEAKCKRSEDKLKAQRGERRNAVVAAVDAAAGKHVDVGQEAVAPCAPSHQHFGMTVALADQGEAGGVSGATDRGGGAAGDQPQDPLGKGQALPDLGRHLT